MALRFFNNVVYNHIDTDPNTMYRDLQQEFVNLQWENTTQIITVKEEEDIGSNVYNDLDIWISPTVADTSTGLKDVRDFNKLIFKDVNHHVKRGLMYIFDNSYWIVHSYTEYDGVVQDCGVRRCNNVLKIRDPQNGGIFSIPCVVDYDMAASTVKVTKYILTPNNHAVIIVQGNEDTLRLFKTNTRYILSGRPFKLYGYQNAVEYDLDAPSTLLYLDLYLDEIRTGDDIENGVAENGRYDYSVSINAEDMTLAQEATGRLTSTVYLNGVEVDRDVLWETEDTDIVSIDEDGNYEVVGDVGESCIITAYMDGNDVDVGQIVITIGELEETVKILTNPSFEIIRQYETIPFNVSVFYNGEEISDDLLVIVGTDSNVLEIKNYDYSFNVNSIPNDLALFNDEILHSEVLEGEILYYNNINSYEVTSHGISNVLQNIYIHVICPSLQINETETIQIKATSMLG